MQTKRKILRVEAGNFTAGSVWEKNEEGTWRCIETAPIVSWMRGMDPQRIHAYLLKRGWSWHWLPDVVS